MDAKKYEKPMVTTVEIPERTAYACNLVSEGCPHISNVVNHGLCSNTNGLWGAGLCD